MLSFHGCLVIPTHVSYVSYVRIWRHHPIETTMLKWMSQVTQVLKCGAAVFFLPDFARKSFPITCDFLSHVKIEEDFFKTKKHLANGDDVLKLSWWSRFYRILPNLWSNTWILRFLPTGFSPKFATPEVSGGSLFIFYPGVGRYELKAIAAKARTAGSFGEKWIPISQARNFQHISTTTLKISGWTFFGGGVFVLCIRCFHLQKKKSNLISTHAMSWLKSRMISLAQHKNSHLCVLHCFANPKKYGFRKSSKDEEKKLVNFVGFRICWLDFWWDLAPWKLQIALVSTPKSLQLAAPKNLLFQRGGRHASKLPKLRSERSLVRNPFYCLL